MNRFLFLFSLSFILISCQGKTTSCSGCDEEQKEETSEQEESVMYEPSELAALMLEMYDANQDWKAEILKGNIPSTFPEKYKKMHGAESVNKSAGGAFYNTMTDTYLESIEALTKATPENAKARYNDMVNVCVSCHNEICPGPIAKINKLIIK